LQQQGGLAIALLDRMPIVNDFIAQHMPVRYFGEPEDVAYLVANLASPLARYITSAVLPVDVGMHDFAP
jgi:NAD(P)-dependent dehydrogenase (short-subunit alcohol dehydrogenase family)